MIQGLILIIIAVTILFVRNYSDEQKVKGNPNDRKALLKFINSSEAPDSCIAAGKYAQEFLNSNKNDFEILEKCAKAFLRSKDGKSLLDFLEPHITNINSIVDNTETYTNFKDNDVDFKRNINNIYILYSSALHVFERYDEAQHFEKKAKSLL